MALCEFAVKFFNILRLALKINKNIRRVFHIFLIVILFIMALVYAKILFKMNLSLFFCKI